MKNLLISLLIGVLTSFNVYAQILWQTPIGNETLPQEPIQVLETPDQHLVVGLLQTHDTIRKWWIGKINGSGTLVWELSLADSLLLQKHWAAMQWNENGNLLLKAATADSTHYVWHEIDTNGNIVNNFETPKPAVANTGSAAIGGGYFEIYNMGNHGVIKKYDDTGNLLWNKIDATTTKYSSLQSTSDGGAIVHGNFNNTGLTMKYDKWGNILWIQLDYMYNFSKYYVGKGSMQITTVSTGMGGVYGNNSHKYYDRTGYLYDQNQLLILYVAGVYEESYGYTNDNGYHVAGHSNIGGLLTKFTNNSSNIFTSLYDYTGNKKCEFIQSQTTYYPNQNWTCPIFFNFYELPHFFLHINDKKLTRYDVNCGLPNNGVSISKVQTHTVETGKNAVFNINGYLNNCRVTDMTVDYYEEQHHFSIFLNTALDTVVFHQPLNKNLDLGVLPVGDYTLSINGNNLGYIDDIKSPSASFSVGTPLPAFGSSTIFNLCEPDTLIFPEVLRWYTDSTLNQLISEGNTFTAINSGIYYVTKVNNATGTETAASEVQIDVRPPQTISYFVDADNMLHIIQSDTTEQVSYWVKINEIYISSSPYYAPPPYKVYALPDSIGQVTIYISRSSGCPIENITFDYVPSPFLFETYSICPNDTITFDTYLNWYSDGDLQNLTGSGNSFSPPTGGMYYVTQIIDSIESAAVPVYVSFIQDIDCFTIPIIGQINIASGITNLPDQPIVIQDVWNNFSDWSRDEGGKKSTTMPTPSIIPYIIPNPAQDIVYIKGIEKVQPYDEVRLFSATGDLILQSGLSTETSLHIGDIPAGYYILLLRNMDKTHYLKFIKIE